MWNKRRIFQSGALVAVLGSIAWLTLRPREPYYKGKPLSVWLEGYDSGEFERPYSAPWLEAQEAVRQIGTNAIPTLLRMMRSKDSSFKLKLKGWFGEETTSKLHMISADRRHFEAMRGFCCLGAHASNAVPALIELFKGDLPGVPDGNYADTAANSLGGIGPAASSAVPLLLGWVTNTNAALRRDAVRILGEIHADPETVVPVLVKSLNDPDTMVRWSAINSLKGFGPAAKSAVPGLLGCLQDKNQDVHDFAIAALKEIDPEAAVKGVVK